jgi:hypothetical protein
MKKVMMAGTLLSLCFALVLPGCGNSGPSSADARTVASDYSLEVLAQKYQDGLVEKCMKRLGFEYAPEQHIRFGPGAGLTSMERAKQFGTSLVYTTLVNPGFYSSSTFSDPTSAMSPADRASYEQALGGFTGFASKGGMVTSDDKPAPGCRLDAFNAAAKQYPALKSRAKIRNRVVSGVAKAQQSSAVKALMSEYSNCMAKLGYKGIDYQTQAMGFQPILDPLIKAAQTSHDPADIAEAVDVDRKLAISSVECYQTIEPRVRKIEQKFSS